MDEPTLTCHRCPESMVYTGGHSCIGFATGLDKWTMTCIHLHRLMQTGLPGIPLFSICSSLPSSNPEATDLFTVSIVLPFPERHVVGIIQCSAFSDWLLSFNRVHISFLHVFSWLHSSYLNNISLSGCTTVYLTFTYWRTSWLHPSFHHYE